MIVPHHILKLYLSSEKGVYIGISKGIFFIINCSTRSQCIAVFFKDIIKYLHNLYTVKLDASGEVEREEDFWILGIIYDFNFIWGKLNELIMHNMSMM